MVDVLDATTFGRVTLQPCNKLRRFVFRGGEEAQAACGSGLGVALPREALRASRFGGNAALWQGPDEWLLLLHDAGDSDALEAALAGLPHSLVEVSDRNLGFTLTGADVEPLLNTACPLDLCEAAFPVGMTTRTIFDKADITLWRTGPETFHVEVSRSFAGYVLGVLREGARGL